MNLNLSDILLAVLVVLLLVDILVKFALIACATHDLFVGFKERLLPQKEEG